MRLLKKAFLDLNQLKTLEIMAKYEYEFKLQTITLEKLKSSNLRDWSTIIELILDEKPLPLNINFSSSRIEKKINEIYNIVIKYELDKTLFQQAVVEMLIEDYDKSSQEKFKVRNYHLIKVIDYIQPAKFFNQLEYLITNPVYKSIYEIYSPEGFPLPCHLLNALMFFDSQKSIFEFLKTKIQESHSPVYYQLIIRYLYMHKADEYFVLFMNENYLNLKLPDIKKYVLLAFNELSINKQSVVMIFNWIFPNHKNLEQRDKKLFEAFREDLLMWMIEREDRLKQTAAFYSLFVFLRSRLPNQLSKDQFDSLLKETGINDRFRFMYFLGAHNSKLRVKDKKGDCKILFAKENPTTTEDDNSITYYVPQIFLEEIFWLSDGIRDQTCSAFQHSTEDITISDYLIQKSQTTYSQ
jgi:hypothetical protein